MFYLLKTNLFDLIFKWDVFFFNKFWKKKKKIEHLCFLTTCYPSDLVMPHILSRDAAHMRPQAMPHQMEILPTIPRNSHNCCQHSKYLGPNVRDTKAGQGVDQIWSHVTPVDTDDIVVMLVEVYWEQKFLKFNFCSKITILYYLQAVLDHISNLSSRGREKEGERKREREKQNCCLFRMKFNWNIN